MTEALSLSRLQQMKRDGRKIVGVVAWDVQMARIVDRAGVDLVSVGDSVGVNLWGHAHPLEVTMDEMLIVTRAVRQLIDWSFAETALERLEIIAAVGNMRSRRVAERVGAVREGVLARRVWVRSNPDLELSPCVLDAGVLYAVVRPAQSGGAVDEAA